ncbi:MAG TPA: hypothetical protein PLF13_05135 [candidate division Zixibacteria bacterium]|nr:hypothetical protein [candidate division Zixibacteria bacterium]
MLKRLPRRLLLLLVTGISFSLCTCGSIHKQVYLPRAYALDSIKTIALWPCLVIIPEEGYDTDDPETVAYMRLTMPDYELDGDRACALADSLLFSKLNETGLFTVHSTGSVEARLRQQEPDWSQYTDHSWKRFAGLFDEDALVVLDLSIRHSMDGVDTYAEMSLYDLDGDRLTVLAKYNTRWDDMYTGRHIRSETLPGAVTGVVEVFEKELRKLPTYGGEEHL